MLYIPEVEIEFWRKYVYPRVVKLIAKELPTFKVIKVETGGTTVLEPGTTTEIILRACSQQTLDWRNSRVAGIDPNRQDYYGNLVAVKEARWLQSVRLIKEEMTT